MADTKISDLTDGGSVEPEDELAVARSGASRKAKPVGADGWVSDVSETWTYASGSGGGVATFTVPGDVRSKYTIGTRVKLTQSATVKYFVISAGSSYDGTNTTVTITGGSDYTLANSTISLNYHSYAANPQGYPGWFNFSPSLTGFSVAPSSVTARFHLIGRICTIRLRTNTGTSNSTGFGMTAPVAAAAEGTGAVQIGAALGTDNGANPTNPAAVRIVEGSTTVVFAKSFATSGNDWTASGNKAIDFTFSYAV